MYTVTTLVHASTSTAGSNAKLAQDDREPLLEDFSISHLCVRHVDVYAGSSDPCLSCSVASADGFAISEILVVGLEDVHATLTGSGSFECFENHIGDTLRCFSVTTTASDVLGG